MKIHDIVLGGVYEGTSDRGVQQTRRVIRIGGKMTHKASHPADRISYQGDRGRGECSALDFTRWAERRVGPKVVRRGGTG